MSTLIPSLFDDVGLVLVVGLVEVVDVLVGADTVVGPLVGAETVVGPLVETVVGGLKFGTTVGPDL